MKLFLVIRKIVQLYSKLLYFVVNLTISVMRLVVSLIPLMDGPWIFFRGNTQEYSMN